MDKRELIPIKTGGFSNRDGGHLVRNILRLVVNPTRRYKNVSVFVTFSAFGKTTEMLRFIAKAKVTNNSRWLKKEKEDFYDFYDKFFTDIVKELPKDQFHDSDRFSLKGRLADNFSRILLEIEGLLEQVKSTDSLEYHRFLAFGEKIANNVIVAVLKMFVPDNSGGIQEDFSFIDHETFIILKEGEKGLFELDEEESEKAFKKNFRANFLKSSKFSKQPSIFIMQGFTGFFSESPGTVAMRENTSDLSLAWMVLMFRRHAVDVFGCSQASFQKAIRVSEHRDALPQHTLRDNISWDEYLEFAAQVDPTYICPEAVNVLGRVFSENGSDFKVIAGRIKDPMNPERGTFTEISNH